jgi:hypothetical protein
MLTKIISGGQTGADRAALEWAKSVGLSTGGFMPRGFLAEDGNHPHFVDLYGIKEHSSPEYPPRTELNVQSADATLLFGRLSSSGTRLTKNLCLRYNKPYLAWGWPYPDPELSLMDLMDFMREYEVINVAGNRESKNRGITVALKERLTAAWKELHP